MYIQSITVAFVLSKEELTCSLCFGELTFPITQCANGNHFVCVSNALRVNDDEGKNNKRTKVH